MRSLPLAYYASAQGRFTSIDPLMASAHTSNPQSWNRYIYVANDPLAYTDSDGMLAVPLDDQQQQDPPPTAVCHPTPPVVSISTDEWSTWATSGVHPEEAVVTANVTVTSGSSETVNAGNVATGSTIALRPMIPLLATGGEAAGVATAAETTGIVACAAPGVAIAGGFFMLMSIEPRAPAYYSPGGGISCTAGYQAYSYYHSLPRSLPPISVPFPPPTLDFGGSWWTCRATGHLTPIPPTQGNGRIVDATGRGPSEDVARAAALNNLQAFQAPGWYVRHMQIKECWRGR